MERSNMAHCIKRNFRLPETDNQDSTIVCKVVLKKRSKKVPTFGGLSRHDIFANLMKTG
jgi:hypothetical protein